LTVTDPELIETFDNFAFDEVLRHGNLDARTRLMAFRSIAHGGKTSGIGLPASPTAYLSETRNLFRAVQYYG
jgi:hypothetical protein